MLTFFDFQTLIQPNIFTYQNKKPTHSGSLNPGQVLTSLKGAARTCRQLHHKHARSRCVSIMTELTEEEEALSARPEGGIRDTGPAGYKVSFPQYL